MEVDFVILADGAEAVNGKVYILGGGWSAIQAPTFPFEYRMSVAVGVSAGWNETNERHTIDVKILTADNAPFMDVTHVEFELGRPVGLKQGESQRIMLASACVLKTDRAEDLQVVVATDGAETGGGHRSTPFKVIAPRVGSMG